MSSPKDYSDPNLALEANPITASGSYEFRVNGRLSEQAAIWFEGMVLIVNEESTPPQTIIRGYHIDQAALYGLISRIRDLGLTLVSVTRIE